MFKSFSLNKKFYIKRKKRTITAKWATILVYRIIMATILCNISALQFYRTPPQVRELLLDDSLFNTPHIPACIARPRSNLSDDALRIRQNLLGILKGVSFPTHVTNTENNRSRADCLAWHRLDNLKQSEVTAIGEGLYVTTPERTLLDLSIKQTPACLAKLVCELCGLYTIVPTNRLMAAAEDVLRANKELVTNNHILAAYYDCKGRILPFVDSNGNAIPWSPCGSKDDTLWKRPPLCSMDELKEFASRVRPNRGVNTLCRSLALSAPGSSSPLETIIALMLGPSRRMGQEGLPAFFLNRQVAVSRDIANAIRSDILVPDVGWYSQSENRLISCCEADGAAYHNEETHSKRRRFYDDSIRRAALLRLYCNVITATYPQVANLEQWDMLVDVLCHALGYERKAPTVLFLKKRDELHREIMQPGPK